ncbi:MAG: hypothetical protein ACWGNV_07850, partial [Bacteroidales bacterium]
ENGVALGTMSNWGWHSFPDTTGYDLSETYRYFEVNGREVPYSTQPKDPRGSAAANYFRENPHRLHLGIIRLLIIKSNGEEIRISDLQQPEQELDLWTGEIHSRFDIEGHPVEVTVYVHQDMDMVSASITSPLMETGQLAVEWLFPYGLAAHTHAGYDFGSPDKHTSELEPVRASSVRIHRILDNDHYFTRISWIGNATLDNPEKHRFILHPEAGENTLEFSSFFSPEREDGELPDFDETRSNNEQFWKGFWSEGGAVDLSACTDPRAPELERRIVLSQYLTRINGSGSLPPQETGLTMNSWYGKFHMEMICWHSAHYVSWQRPGLAGDQLKYYRHIEMPAKELASLQGYRGVRWPKMTGPDGRNSPSSVGNYLIWQQPHLIYLAEQQYQAAPSAGVLEAYADLIFATADFMADFAVLDTLTGRYNLEPPLIPAQEHWNRETTRNPPFELAYWYWGLTTAQLWKERLGLERDPVWEEVRTHLAAPVAIDGLYMGIGNAPDSYTDPENMRDHPMVLGALGMLPGWDKVDPEIMRKTLKLIMKKWNWLSTWGWDYPMVAMCATRLLEPEIAIDALMMDVQKNTYLVSGHNFQDNRLRLYLPGNGGLLKAVALMCAGWEGCTVENPGFPKDGTWNVRWENLTPDF